MSPATEPTTWGSPMQSTASPAAGPQPDNVLITIKFWADAKGRDCLSENLDEPVRNQGHPAWR